MLSSFMKDTLSTEHVDIFLKLLTLHADDTIVSLKVRPNFKMHLMGLKTYCDTWRMNINTSKTKRIVFEGARLDLNQALLCIGWIVKKLDDEFHYILEMSSL